MQQASSLKDRRASGLLLGTNVYAAKGDAERRQGNGIKSMLALKGCSILNLQFEDEAPLAPTEFPTLCALKCDAPSVTGRKGPRKPIVSEMFTLLAREAVLLGRRYFGFSNSDICISQAVVDLINRDATKTAYIFSREDFDGANGQPIGMVLAGSDMFIVDAKWWLDNRTGFLPYIVGEPVWDNVYTSRLLCLGNGILLNRDPLIRHEWHERTWLVSPFAEYTRMLASLDALYFSRWVSYWDQMTRLRTGDPAQAEEIKLQQSVFTHHLSSTDRAVQAIRSAKATVRYAVMNRLGG